MDKRADPDFIESKGYVHVGASIANLSQDNMPSHDSIVDFSRKLAANLGYVYTAERRESRVSLISKDPSRAKIDFSAI
jgi:tRNA wybutosine-synthesizing protein 1